MLKCPAAGPTLLYRPRAQAEAASEQLRGVPSLPRSRDTPSSTRDCRAWLFGRTIKRHRPLMNHDPSRVFPNSPRPIVGPCRPSRAVAEGTFSECGNPRPEHTPRARSGGAWCLVAWCRIGLGRTRAYFYLAACHKLRTRQCAVPLAAASPSLHLSIRPANWPG